MGDQAADPSATPEVGPALPGDDLSILAEVMKSGEGGDETENPDATEIEATADDPAPDEEKPEEPEAAKPKTETEEVKQARKIMASANRKLAFANRLVKQANDAKANIVNGLKKTPHATLRELGLSIGEVLEAEPDPDAAPKPEPTADERVKQLEARLAAKEASEAAAHEQAEITRLTNEIHADLKTKAAEFPLLNRGKGSHQLVTDLMVEHHATKGKFLPAVEAARVVEEYLRELAGTQSPPAQSPGSNGRPNQQRQGSQTLRNTEIRGATPDPDDIGNDLETRAAVAARELGLNVH